MGFMDSDSDSDDSDSDSSASSTAARKSPPPAAAPVPAPAPAPVAKPKAKPSWDSDDSDDDDDSDSDDDSDDSPKARPPPKTTTATAPEATSTTQAETAKTTPMETTSATPVVVEQVSKAEKKEASDLDDESDPDSDEDEEFVEESSSEAEEEESEKEQETPAKQQDEKQEESAEKPKEDEAKQQPEPVAAVRVSTLPGRRTSSRYLIGRVPRETTKDWEETVMLVRRHSSIESRGATTVSFGDPVVTEKVEYIQDADAPLAINDIEHVIAEDVTANGELTWCDTSYQELPWWEQPDVNEEDELTALCKKVMAAGDDKTMDERRLHRVQAKVAYFALKLKNKMRVRRHNSKSSESNASSAGPAAREKEQSPAAETQQSIPPEVTPSVTEDEGETKEDPPGDKEEQQWGEETDEGEEFIDSSDEEEPDSEVSDTGGSSVSEVTGSKSSLADKPLTKEKPAVAETPDDSDEWSEGGSSSGSHSKPAATHVERTSILAAVASKSATEEEEDWDKFSEAEFSKAAKSVGSADDVSLQEKENSMDPLGTKPEQKWEDDEDSEASSFDEESSELESTEQEKAEPSKEPEKTAAADSTEPPPSSGQNDDDSEEFVEEESSVEEESTNDESSSQEKAGTMEPSGSNGEQESEVGDESSSFEEEISEGQSAAQKAEAIATEPVEEPAAPETKVKPPNGAQDGDEDGSDEASSSEHETTEEESVVQKMGTASTEVVEEPVASVTESPPGSEDGSEQFEEEASSTKDSQESETAAPSTAKEALEPAAVATDCATCHQESEFVSEGMVPCPYCGMVYYCSKDCLTFDLEHGQHGKVCKGAGPPENPAGTASADLDGSIEAFDTTDVRKPASVMEALQAAKLQNEKARAKESATKCAVCQQDREFISENMIPCPHCELAYYCSNDCLAFDLELGQHGKICEGATQAVEKPTVVMSGDLDGSIHAFDIEEIRRPQEGFMEAIARSRAEAGAKSQQAKFQAPPNASVVREVLLEQEPGTKPDSQQRGIQMSVKQRIAAYQAAATHSTPAEPEGGSGARKDSGLGAFGEKRAMQKESGQGSANQAAPQSTPVRSVPQQSRQMGSTAGVKPETATIPKAGQVLEPTPGNLRDCLDALRKSGSSSIRLELPSNLTNANRGSMNLLGQKLKTIASASLKTVTIILPLNFSIGAAYYKDLLRFFEAVGGLPNLEELSIQPSTSGKARPALPTQLVTSALQKLVSGHPDHSRSGLVSLSIQNMTLLDNHVDLEEFAEALTKLNALPTMKTTRIAVEFKTSQLVTPQ